jgi:hypothetical protein
LEALAYLKARWMDLMNTWSFEFTINPALWDTFREFAVTRRWG